MPAATAAAISASRGPVGRYNSGVEVVGDDLVAGATLAGVSLPLVEL